MGYQCVALTDKCQGGTAKNVATAFGKSGKSGASDWSCAADFTDKCRDATSHEGVAMGATVEKAWTSATDALCVDLTADDCRKADHTKTEGTRTATDDMTCKDLG